MMSRFVILVLLLCFGLQACMKRKYADLVVHNAVIHILDEENTIAEAMAIKDGKILEVGPERQILNKYRWGKSVDAGKRHIYPGITDAYSHLIHSFMASFEQSGNDKGEFNVAFKDFQRQLLRFGIVEIHEMGGDAQEFEFLKAAAEKGVLNIKIHFAMNPTEENYQFVQRLGDYRTQNLALQGFQFGIPNTSDWRLPEVEKWSSRCATLQDQFSIVPSSNWNLNELAQTFAPILRMNPDHRWRFIHAVAIHQDFYLTLRQNGVFGILPCKVVTDASMKGQYWVANASLIPVNYQEIISGFGVFALGLQLNFKESNPFQDLSTFFSHNNLAETPAQVGETYRLTLEDALKAITIWPQFAVFSETKRGALTEGMEATFFVAKFRISKDKLLLNNASVMTFIRGEKIFDAQEGY